MRGILIFLALLTVFFGQIVYGATHLSPEEVARLRFEASPAGIAAQQVKAAENAAREAEQQAAWQAWWGEPWWWQKPWRVTVVDNDQPISKCCFEKCPIEWEIRK